MRDPNRHTPRHLPDIETVPFRDAEEAWFWFIQAQAALNEGARFAAGQSLVPRPCEPHDIYKVMDRLYRARRLVMDHLLVLRHYGRRQMPPDARRVKEARAHTLWQEAMERMNGPLVRKGIVQAQTPMDHIPNRYWTHRATLYDGQGVSR